MIKKNRVVITGIGVLAANGIGKDAFWNSLLAGKSGIGPITQFDASEIPWNIAGEIKNFVPEDFINPKFKPSRQSRNTQLATAATVMALKDADITLDILKTVAPIPIILGISLGGMDLLEQHTRRIIDKGLNRALPSAAACVHIFASSFIAAILGVPSELSVLSNSCTGGLDAIAAGASAIKRGEMELAVVGGTDAVIIPSVISGLGSAGMLANGILPPDKVSRPFDLKRTGGVAAEGAGVLILESLDHAQNRGVKQYAELLGHGAASSVNTYTSVGFENSMGKALANAACLREDISYINAHGPSDPSLDIAETVAIKNVLGTHAYRVPVTSIKGATGNPLAAGGALQAIACSLSTLNGVIPPTTNYETADPDCDLDYVASIPRSMDVFISMVNSHGTGGVNSTLIIKKI